MPLWTLMLLLPVGDPESTSVPPKTLVAPVVVLLPESVIMPVPNLVRAICPVPVAIVPAKVPPPALP